MSTSPPPLGQRLLVIEDEESMRHALTRVLSRAGYAVDAAPTGGEGVARLRAGGYDLVLTDVRLPDMSGLDVVAVVTETSPKTPVVVMTAFGTVETALVAMKRGARDFVTKPFDMPVLLETLARALAAPATPDEARLRLEVERRFAPAAFRAIEAPAAPALRPAPPTVGAPPGEAAMPRAAEAPLDLRDAQRRFEIRYVEDLLARTGGNIAAAARLAGISRPNFHRKLRVLGVDPLRFKRARARGRTSGT